MLVGQVEEVKQARSGKLDNQEGMCKLHKDIILEINQRFIRNRRVL